MPRLRQARREAFVRNIIASVKTGKSQAQCYEDAGYTTTGNASEANASRLLSDAKVKERLDELVRPAAMKTTISLNFLSEEILKTIQDARSKDQHGVVVRAMELAAKIHGLMKQEISVEHTFTDRQEIMQSIAKRFGQEAAEVLAKALTDGPGAITDQRRERLMRDVTPEPRRVDEASPELIAGQPRD
jgi:hypothetical protein